MERIDRVNWWSDSMERLDGANRWSESLEKIEGADERLYATDEQLDGATRRR